ncbi:hypothetical protein SLE2022_282980 [Rubroshorea leprosula]
MGILLGYFVGNFQINAIGGWPYMYGFSAQVALLMGVGMWSLPPSPCLLLLRAVQVKSTNVEKESEGNFLEIFQGPSLKAFIIGGGLVLFQQITGKPSVLYYAGPILQSAGFSAAADATRVSIIIAVAKVDNLGRRPLLFGGVSGIALSLFLLAAYYKFLGGLPLVAVAALLLYISFGPISWLMVSEIFPLRTRGKGISLAVLTNFGSNAIVTFVFSPLKELLGADNLFLLFGAIALSSLLFVALYVPETKGRSLEEIESKIRN